MADALQFSFTLCRRHLHYLCPQRPWPVGGDIVRHVFWDDLPLHRGIAIPVRAPGRALGAVPGPGLLTVRGEVAAMSAIQTALLYLLLPTYKHL